MPYYIAGIDVHKKMLAIVVADVSGDGEYHFEQLKTGTSPAQLRALADWLTERDVAEVVMESTARYWRPVWEALERRWQPRRARDGAPAHLYLAQAQSNRGVGGPKKDFPDAERLVKRLAAHHEAVHRLAEVPGLGVEAAQQIIAEVGVTAATFPSPRRLASRSTVARLPHREPPTNAPGEAPPERSTPDAREQQSASPLARDVEPYLPVELSAE